MKIHAAHFDHAWRPLFGLGLLWISLEGVLLFLALWWQ
jgi:hypothetical protein